MPRRSPAARVSTASSVLCIDIGGSHVKAAVVAPDGTVRGESVKVETPVGEGPAALVEAIVKLVEPLERAPHVAIGFPGALRDDLVLTAPNLGGVWQRVPLPKLLSERLGRPVRMANDAAVQGLGAISGKGLECAITLGTGMGFAVFRDGEPGVQFELGRHTAHKNKTYDEYVGDKALGKKGRQRWNRRVQKVIDKLRALVNFDVLYIGGGNARLVDFPLPADVHLVSNETGILGGVRLWNGFPESGPKAEQA
ncbi:MAG TPA: ROK family protein [Acetobacteraceae bacterium]|jgi:polyphosphate glucokinase|nr:ROK family protein [Acetobacteraceae bacterium]